MTKKIELKTKKTKQSVTTFLNSIDDPQKRKDAKVIAKMMKEVTGHSPKMWGPSIVGYGTWMYKRSNGDEGDFLAIGFSPRKTALTIYIMPGYQDFTALLKKLGPYKKGKSCLYIKRLEDIDLPTLQKIVTKGWKYMQKTYGVK